MHSISLFQRPRWLALGTFLLVAALVSLAACAPGGRGTSQSAASGTTLGSTPNATPTKGTGNSGTGQGTLNGVVLAGPTCPVETADSPCPPRPVANRQVTIETTAGKIVATVTTDQQGHFSANLPPGTYVLRLVPDGGKLPIQRTLTVVTIVAGKTISIQIMLDTGIR
jgi:hypothetical protein